MQDYRFSSAPLPGCVESVCVGGGREGWGNGVRGVRCRVIDSVQFRCQVVLSLCASWQLVSYCSYLLKRNEGKWYRDCCENRSYNVWRYWTLRMKHDWSRNGFFSWLITHLVAMFDEFIQRFYDGRLNFRLLAYVKLDVRACLLRASASMLQCYQGYHWINCSDFLTS